MNITSTTKYDMDAHIAFFNANHTRANNSKKRIIIYGATSVITILFLAVSLMSLLGDYDLILILALISPLSIIALISIYVVLINILIPYIGYKKTLNTNGITNVKYTFSDDLILQETDSDKIMGLIKISYNTIVKVIETPRYFFLYQTSNSANIVDKSTFLNGTPDQLREKLLSYVPDYKYLSA